MVAQDCLHVPYGNELILELINGFDSLCLAASYMALDFGRLGAMCDFL